MVDKYSDKLKDPRWQKKRLEILQRDNWECQRCEDKKSTLHVHHRRYIPGRDPWDYPEETLVTLCEDCHEEESASINETCSDLIAMIRDKFYSNEVYILADAFHLLEVENLHSHAVAEMIHWVLSDPEVFKEMNSRYLDVWYKETHKE
jgi:hypothetical protein